jgi:hypothetical protein
MGMRIRIQEAVGGYRVTSVGENKEDSRYALAALRAIVPGELRSANDDYEFVYSIATDYLYCWLHHLMGEIGDLDYVFEPLPCVAVTDEDELLF